MPVEKNQFQPPKTPAIDWNNIEFDISAIDNLLLPNTLDSDGVMDEILIDKSTLPSLNTSIAKEHSAFTTSSCKIFFTCLIFK